MDPLLPKTSQNSLPPSALLLGTFSHTEGGPQGLDIKWGQSPSSAAPRGLSGCEPLAQQPMAAGQTHVQDRQLCTLGRDV